MQQRFTLRYAALAMYLFLAAPVSAGDIWVAVNGSDLNDGTQGKPYASVAMALRKAREWRRLNDAQVKGGIQIRVGPGVYQLAEPIFIRPEDAGTPESVTTIASAGGEVVLSGGIQIGGWRKLTARLPGLPALATRSVWVAEVPPYGGRPTEFRQLWINDIKATRARERNADSMSRILSWDHQHQSCWIPRPAGGNIAYADGMEMVIHQWWAIAMLRIKSLQPQGDSARLTFHQPESRVQSEHPWPAPWISKKTGNSAYYLANALQFLDEPGEWYHDIKSGKLYYWPRAGENMQAVTATVPMLETLVRIAGTIDQPVSYVTFRDIGVAHTTWLRPSREGHVPHQAGMYMLDAYKLRIPGTPDKKGLENQAWIGRPPGAVSVKFAHHITLEGCRFEHLASAGLDMEEGVHHSNCSGNLFKDIGGNGMQIGIFSKEPVETHLPYNPADAREVCSGIHVRNNLVTDVTNEDWGCVGIAVGFARDMLIDHNEISEVSYSGISMGWGWTRTINAMRNNTISANRIHHYAKHMYDVAGIYTLSAQPGSVIARNYVDSIYKAPYPHDPNHWFYLYTDEGSSYFTVKDNWCPSQKFLQNANGPNNVWENNGPMVADSIKQAAGLEPAFRNLLKERVVDENWDINK